MKPEESMIANRPSWVVKNNTVKAAVTRQAGQMAPVYFCSDTDDPVQPYYISPWYNESIEVSEPVLSYLRGDFFCMPFGHNNVYGGENHPAHGETASSTWGNPEVTTNENTITLKLHMQTKQRPGHVTKRIMLREGHNVVYCTHVLEGFSGVMSLGHHPTLAVPAQEGAMRITTGPFYFGMTTPRAREFYHEAEYYSIASGQNFTDLGKVPTVWKDAPYTDCSVFPAREGFMDVIGIFSIAGDYPGWTAAAVPSEGYLWFSLKDPRMLPATIFWMANKGRHASPWLGRNRCLGIEDVCSYLAEGLTPSAEHNPVNERGIHTVLSLSPDKPTVINHLQGVVKIPSTFERVEDISFDNGSITFQSPSGETVSADVDWNYVFSAES